MTKQKKLSEYVAAFLAKLGVRCVFAISGGASLHLIHGIADTPDIDYVTPHHEMAAAMAADGYARVAQSFGVAMATSGPGATNLITGISGCFYDSIPAIFITGQTSTFRMVGDTGVRQVGFQEMPIVDICRKITKYAVTVERAEDIRYELEKSVFIAQQGRPGPVLIDIPDNIQRVMVSPEALHSFRPVEENERDITSFAADEFLRDLEVAQRPVLIFGWGLRLGHATNEAIAFAEKYNIPVALTWGAADILSAAHPLYIGTFGTHGTRHANFAVQNADLILSLGSRLDTKATGTPINSFARGAKKYVVDIDANELNKFAKFGLHIERKIQCDVKKFLLSFANKTQSQTADALVVWRRQIADWKKRFAAIDVLPDSLLLNPYKFMDALSHILPPKANLFIDTGCGIAWAMQGLKLAKGQRTYHDFNNTAMGWALPAAIGGYMAKPDAPTIVLSGDGSLMMSLHELATVKHHKMPIKIILLNNEGYAMIRQTQDQWFSSRYLASSYEGGLSFPCYKELAAVFGLTYLEINTDGDSELVLSRMFTVPGSCLCNVVVPRDAKVVPQVVFGRPNEDPTPLLQRDVFLNNMIVEPLDISRKANT